MMMKFKTHIQHTQIDLNGYVQIDGFKISTHNKRAIYESQSTHTAKSNKIVRAEQKRTNAETINSIQCNRFEQNARSEYFRLEQRAQRTTKRAQKRK